MRFLLAVFLWIAAPAYAEIGRPTSIDDTLRILADAFAQTGAFETVEIDADDQSISLKTSDDRSLLSYPDNVHREFLNAATDSERQEVLDRHIAATVETLGFSETGEDDRPNILPVVRRERVEDDVPGKELLSTPLVGNLRTYYVIDRPNTLTYLSVEALADIGLDKSDVPTLAIENFQARGYQPEFRGEGLWMLVLDGNFEATFLLDTELWQDIDAQLDTVLMAALARDVILFTDASVEGAENRLRQVIDENFDQMSYQLSPDIYVWSEGEWKLR